MQRNPYTTYTWVAVVFGIIAFIFVLIGLLTAGITAITASFWMEATIAALLFGIGLLLLELRSKP